MKSAGGSQTLTIGNICVEEHAAAHFDLSRALFITELALPLAFAEGAWGVPPKCRRARPFCSQKMPPGVPEPQSTQIRCLYPYYMVVTVSCISLYLAVEWVKNDVLDAVTGAIDPSRYPRLLQ